eukprot:TRINITY_DN56674_c0_g1_i1.p1 TRINITY_DN56674_c0_g1~~TRINITY_DN56674_c0_g1_i1.p1  ORF type:complete len:254 (+),score=42.90 TRINITY_DN56674_c0_g1_i1:90-851(+)
MVITVQTLSGMNIAVELSVADTVQAAKDKVAPQLGVFPSQLVLLHGDNILQDTLALADACGEHPLEAQLTVVTSPLSGGFYFNSSDDDCESVAGSNTSAGVWAFFQNGDADIVVTESEITSESSDEDEQKDPYDSGMWLARYKGVIEQMDQSDFNIDVALCQRRGSFDDERAAKPSKIRGKMEANGNISLELVFAAGGCNDFIRSAAGLRWVVLRPKSEILDWDAMLKEVAQFWVPTSKPTGSKAKSSKCAVS